MDILLTQLYGMIMILNMFGIVVAACMIYNNAAGILRALGRADIPFRILVISCGMNIILDLLLTGILCMGIAGVSLATVILE